MASERRHIPVGKQHIGVGNVCIWCDQPMPCREILLDEHQRLLQRSRDEDTARIRLNHARIEAEAEVARLQALLAERDAEIARLREAGNVLADAVAWKGVQVDGIGVWADEQLSGEQRRYLIGLMATRSGGYEVMLKRWRATLAAAGGEDRAT